MFQTYFIDLIEAGDSSQQRTPNKPPSLFNISMPGGGSSGNFANPFNQAKRFAADRPANNNRTFNNSRPFNRGGGFGNGSDAARFGNVNLNKSNNFSQQQQGEQQLDQEETSWNIPCSSGSNSNNMQSQKSGNIPLPPHLLSGRSSNNQIDNNNPSNSQGFNNNNFNNRNRGGGGGGSFGNFR